MTRSVCWDYDENSREDDKIDEMMPTNFIENRTIGFVQSKKEAQCNGHILLDQIIGLHDQNSKDTKYENIKASNAHPKSVRQ